MIVPTPDRHEATRQSVELLADPGWRRLLADAEPMPGAARGAFPALAAVVVGASAPGPGTAVLAMRSYLAPLGLAVAQQLGSPWRALDLDDDDESLAAAQGDEAGAEAFRRLVSTFAPQFSGRQPGVSR